MKNYNYTIYRKTKYLFLILCISLLLIILPIVAGVILEFYPICVFGLCGFILVLYFAYEYFYTNRCKIIISERSVTIKKPLFCHEYKKTDIFWSAKQIGFRGGYNIYIKQGNYCILKINLDWENVNRILLLNHCNPITRFEKEVIKIINNFQ